jgi:hypothetical protein
MRRLALVLLAAVIACGAAGAASRDSMNVLMAVRSQLATVDRDTSVPILLPSTLPVRGSLPPMRLSSIATDRTWLFVLLTTARTCAGGTSCFVASFAGESNGVLPRAPNVRLTTGDRAIYLPGKCEAADCSPASLWFTHGGTLYSWQLKNPPAKSAKALLLLAAEEAISAGPRTPG